MMVVLVVVAPAEQREEVDEGLGQVAAGELLDGHRPVPLRELAAVAAVDVRDVGVDRKLRAERAQG